MQSKPTNWVTGFKRSPRASNVQMRDMGLFMNSSGRFETLDDSWDSIHSEGMFISGANKLYFRDEDNKDIYINSPADNQLELSASLGVIVGDTLLISDDNKIQLRNTDDTLYINSPATNQIRLEATAGVSINTTDMEGATGLNVHGTIRATGMVLESAISAIEFTIKPDSGDAMLHFEKSDASREFTVGYDDGNDLFVISDNDAFGTNDRLVINADGDVGIGTSLPAAELNVEGATGYRAIRLTSDTTDVDLYANAETPEVGISSLDPVPIAFKVNGSKHLSIDEEGTLDQQSNYLVNSQTVNDLQTRSSYWFDGVDDYIDLGVLDAVAIPANTSWSYEVSYKVKSADSNGVIVYFPEHGLYVHSNGNTYEFDPSDTTSFPTVLDTWNHVLAVNDQSSNVTTVYLNGVSVDTRTYSGDTDPWEVDLGRDSWNGGSHFDGEISKFRLYNRALSSDEVKAAYSGEAVPFADIGANQTAIYASSGDFTGDMTASGGAASNVTQDGKANSYKFTVNSSAGTHYLNTPTSSLVIGKHYRVETYYYIPSGNANIDGFRWQGADAYGGDWQNPIIAGTYDAWTLNSQEFIAGATVLYPVTFDGATNSYTGNGTDAIYFHEVVITQIGNVAEYLPTSIGATQWLDTSGNGLDGTVTGATQTHPTVFGGKVGIGTGDPDGILHIKNNRVATGENAFYFETYNTTGSYRSSLQFRKSNSATLGAFVETVTDDSFGHVTFTGVNTAATSFAPVSARIEGYQDGAAGATYVPGRLEFKTATNSAAATTHMTIDSDGNVGIGQDTPTTLLHLEDHVTNYPVLIKQTGDYNAIIKQDSNRSLAGKGLGGFQAYWNGTRVGSVEVQTGDDTINKDNGYIRFRTASAGSAEEVMRIEADGTLDQKSNYLVNSQTVNDLQTKQSLRFTGGDHVTITDHLLSTDLSVSLWFNSSSLPTASATVQVLACNPQGFGIALYYTSVGGGIFIIGTTVSQRIANVVGLVSVGEWNHLAVTYDSTGIPSYYLNGVEITTYGTSNYLAVTSSDYYIGRRASGYAFEGEISKFQVYNRALSADEVKASYSGQAVPFSETGANQTELLTDGLLEIWTDATTLTNWTKIIVGTGTSLDRSTDSYSGTYSASLTAGASASYAIIWQGESFTVGKKYKISLWAKSADGGAFYLRTHQNNDTGSINSGNANESLSSSWTNYTYEFIAGSGTGADNALVIVNTVDGTATLIDDVSIVQIGCVAEYLPTSIGDTTWLDTSGNALHGTVTGATQVGQNIFGGPVGIGTADPGDSRLYITQDSTSNPVLTLFDADAIAYDFVFPDTNTLKITCAGGADRTFELNNSAGGVFNLKTDGNLVMGGAGKGIDFSGAGTAAEILHDYEEGTFTPVVSDLTNTATMNGSYDTCNYVKIGRTVFWNGFLSLTSKGSLSGSLALTGFPFAKPAGNENAGAATIGYFTSATGLTTAASLSLYMSETIARCWFTVTDGTGAITILQDSEITDTFGFIVSGFYSTT